MERTLIIISYFVIIITILYYFSNFDNLSTDENIRDVIETTLFNNTTIKSPNIELQIDYDIETYKKLQDRRYTMILEQIQRQSVTNSHIMENQTHLLNSSSAANVVKTVYNNISYKIDANGESNLNLDDILNLSSGDSHLVSAKISETGTDSSLVGGYLGKYINTRMKSELVYSIEHEINNAVRFKATFETAIGNIKIFNLTDTEITLTVLIKTLELV